MQPDIFLVTAETEGKRLQAVCREGNISIGQRKLQCQVLVEEARWLVASNSVTINLHFNCAHDPSIARLIPTITQLFTALNKGQV